MMDLFMVNWSGQPVPDQDMMVMRRVAIMMRTVYGATKVGFVHDICAGQVTYEKPGVYGAVGGHFFFGDFGAKNDMPNTVDFFIPRSSLRLQGSVGMVIHQTSRRQADGTMVFDYPEDVDPDIILARGKLKVSVLEEG